MSIYMNGNEYGGFNLNVGNGGASDFVVTFSTTDGTSFTADKTYAATMAAYNNGDRIIFAIPALGTAIEPQTYADAAIAAYFCSYGSLTGSMAQIASLSLNSDNSVSALFSPDLINDPHPYILEGRNLKDVFGSASAFHSAVAAEDFSNIRVGDYWQITLTGNYRDYGEGTDAGEYQQKSFSNAIVNLEVAAINPYWKYGDSGSIASGTPHVLFISRDCLPTALKMRKADTLWEDETSKMGWAGSALYRTLNDPDYGIVKLVATTDIGAYMYSGNSEKGMRYNAEKRDPITSTSISPAWYYRGELFLPTEDEVWGSKIFGATSYQGMQELPIFHGSRRRVVKGLGNGGSSANMWTLTMRSNKAENFCAASYRGAPSDEKASTACGVPLCFLVT